MDLFILDNDLDGEFLMSYSGNRATDTWTTFMGEYGYMGTYNNAAFYVQKKCWKDGCELANVKWHPVNIYKESEDGSDKNHWIGRVKYFSLIS